MVKTLDENLGREVGQELHVEDMKSLEEVLHEVRESFSEKMKEAFDCWSQVFCKNVNDVYHLQGLMERFIRNYGETFAFSFYIYGVRWKKLSFFQFELVLDTVDRVSGNNADFKESGMRAIVDDLAAHENEQQSDDATSVDSLLAVQRGGIRADRLISLFLNFGELKYHPERSAYVADLIARYGKDIAERACFLMDREKFSQGYLSELLLMEDHAFPLGEEFLDACERWFLTDEEARNLRLNVLNFYAKHKSYDAIRDKILRKNQRPPFLGRKRSSLH
ncbi:hypothetical protein KC725_03655 [Candidatus Peregrinibacteria bacterium]|nr:hypothetical protein [Candidatus Peregrinibacteria bacterium]